MITYSYLTKQQLLEGIYSRKIDSDDGFIESALYGIRDHSGDEIVGVIAEDNDRLVGRLLLSYTDILVDGKLIRCAVGSNLYVTESFRRKAVGIKLLWKFMERDIPYIAASTSADASRLFSASRQFHLIDNSPIFTCGLRLDGSIRTARLALQRDEKVDPGISMSRQIQVVTSKVLRGWRLKYSDSRAITELTPKETEAFLPKLVDLRNLPVYLPWNKSVLLEAINRVTGSPRAWMITHSKSNVAQNYLLTLYLTTKEWSLFRTKDIREVKVARLTEIFPPVSDAETGEDLITFAAQKARHMGAAILEVPANTEALKHACGKLDFENFSRKTIWFAPGNAKGGEIDKMCDPAAWWCRGMNEDQFEETYQPVGASRLLADSSVLL